MKKGWTNFQAFTVLVILLNFKYLFIKLIHFIFTSDQEFTVFKLSFSFADNVG